MGVNREPEQPAVGAGLVVAYDALDRHAGLAFIEHHGLVVGDAVLIQHVRVDPDGMGATAWISARIEQVRGRVQAHRIARRLLTSPPQFGDRVRALEFHHPFVRATQPPGHLKRTHRR